MRSFRYRLRPTRAQTVVLDRTLTTCRHTYNDALAERITAYKNNGTSLSKYDQHKGLTNHKTEYQQLVYVQVLREVLNRLDQAYANFFRRVKAKRDGKKIKAGFPRFKSERRFNSFCYTQLGFRLADNNKRVCLSKIGAIRLVYHRPVEGIIKTCRVLRDVDQWFVIFVCDTESKLVAKSAKPTVGVDVGIKSLAVLSTGEAIDNPRHWKNAATNLAKQQRRLARKKRGSKNRRKQVVRVARCSRKIRRQRDDFLHKLSRRLVSDFGCVVFEKLNIAGMMRNHCLAKHIGDAAWGKLIQFTTYKAANAGAEVSLVSPNGTSQMCSGCGAKVPKALAERTHRCKCGLTMGRDHNAAINIKARGGTPRSYACGDSTTTREYCALGQVESRKQEIHHG